MSVPPDRATIESLCVTVTSGGTPSRANATYWDGGTVPWFKTGELNDWYVDDAEERITEDALAASSAKLFPPGTVLMAMYGDGKTITTLGLLRAEAATNQACCAMITDEDKCHFLYLFYALKYHRHELLNLVVSGAQRNLSGGIIRSFKINCHPLATQTRIAAVLSSYDDLIDNNRRRIKLLEDSVRLMFDEWFARLRFPGNELAAVVDGVPVGWTREPLGASVVLRYGKALKAEDRSADGDVPVYGSSGVVGTHDKAMVPGPAIIVGRKGNVGSVFRCARDFWPIDTVYFVDAPTSDLYLYYALRNMHFISTDVAVPGLNRDFAYSRPLLSPPAELRARFLDVAGPIHQQIDTLAAMNEKLRTARDLLLPRLMSGELTV